MKTFTEICIIVIIILLLYGYRNVYPSDRFCCAWIETGKVRHFYIFHQLLYDLSEKKKIKLIVTWRARVNHTFTRKQ